MEQSDWSECYNHGTMIWLINDVRKGEGVGIERRGKEEREKEEEGGGQRELL